MSRELRDAQNSQSYTSRTASSSLFVRIERLAKYKNRHKVAAIIHWDIMILWNSRYAQYW